MQYYATLEKWTCTVYYYRATEREREHFQSNNVNGLNERKKSNIIFGALIKTEV